MGKVYEYKDASGESWSIEKKIEQKPNSKGKIIIYTATKGDVTLSASRKSVLKQMLFEKYGAFEKTHKKCKLTFDVPYSIVELRNIYRYIYNLESQKVSKKQIEEWLVRYIIKHLEPHKDENLLVEPEANSQA